MEMSPYLHSTSTINFADPTVMDFAAQHAGNRTDPQELAIHFFYAVRDSIMYDPYTIKMTAEGLCASTTLEKGRAWCVPKAILLAACCRAYKVPARLGFADVRNHLATERMKKMMQSDIFFWHAYTSIYLGGRWIRATPAFNIELCERFQLKPLDFDGRSDALFHSFDLTGKKHMEYIQYRGEFSDVPIDQIKKTFQDEYLNAGKLNKSDFERDVAFEKVGNRK